MVNIIKKWLASINADRPKPVKYHEWALIDRIPHEPMNLITCIHCHVTIRVLVGIPLTSPMLVTRCPDQKEYGASK